MRYGIVLLFSGMLLWPSNSFAQGVCFDDDTAGRMVVALEQARISEGQIEALNGSSQELIQQKEILQSTVKLLQDQIVVYKNMADMNAKMSDMKDKACEAQVKSATPTFMDNLTKYLAGVGVGGILAGIAILLL